MASEEWQGPVKRGKSQRASKTRAGNRLFVCNNKFEAIAKQGWRHEDQTRDWDVLHARFFEANILCS